MNDNNYDKLISAASSKLGIKPEELKKMLEKGDMKALSAGLSKQDKEKLRAVLGNEKLMSSLKKASSPDEVMKILKND